MSELSALLGFNTSTRTSRLAREMVKSDRRLIGKLVQLRRQQRLTQEDLAGRMGVSQSAIAKFENGPGDPRLSTLRRYALALGVEVTHQVGGHDCSAVDDMIRRGDHVIREIESYLEARPSQRVTVWNPHDAHQVRVPTHSGVVTIPLSDDDSVAVGRRVRTKRPARP